MNTSTITEPIVRLADRMPSVGAIADDVSGAVSNIAPDVSKTAKQAKRSIRRALPMTSSPRPRSRWFAAIGTVLVLAAVLGWWMRRKDDAQQSGSTGGTVETSGDTARTATLVA